MAAKAQKNQALLLADDDGSDDEDCIDDDDDNSSDPNFEDGEIEVMNDRKTKAAKKAFADADDDCEGVDDSGEYDDDAEDMDDESLDDEYDDQSDNDKKKAKKEAASDGKNSSGDDTPKLVLPQVNAETKLQDKAIEALLMAEAVKKSQ